MNIGDRVITPDGPGEVVHEYQTPDQLGTPVVHGKWFYWVNHDTPQADDPKYFPAEKVKPE